MRANCNIHNLVAGLPWRETRIHELAHGELATLVAAERNSGGSPILLEGHPGDEDERTVVGTVAEIHEHD